MATSHSATSTINEAQGQMLDVTEPDQYTEAYGPSDMPSKFMHGGILATSIEQASDVELVQQTLAGDEQAFAEIVRRHSARVFRIASRFFRQRSQVEEIAQEVFLKAYTQLANFEARGAFEGWLARITTSICLNTIRSARRHPELSIADLTESEQQWLDHKLQQALSPARPSESAIERNLVAADLAEKLLSTLSPDDRLVLTLMESEELSVKEIAALTGWSSAKIKIQAFRARNRLRKALEQLIDR